MSKVLNDMRRFDIDHSPFIKQAFESERQRLLKQIDGYLYPVCQFDEFNALIDEFKKQVKQVVLQEQGR